MYRAFTKTLALVILVAASFSACKKDKDEDVALTKENLAGTYKVTGLTVAGQEAFNQWYTDCEKDDLYKLNADLSYAYVDAGTSCGNGDESGTWSISDKKIVIDGAEGTVEKFDGKTLIISAPYQGVTWKTTYTKQ